MPELSFHGWRFLALPLVALAIASCSEEQRPPDLVIQTTTDLVYLEGGDAKLQALDIYAPAGADGAPVVVYVHGGAYRAGDKEMVGDKPHFFCSRGYVVVSINYRLAPAVRHPTWLEDTAAAFAWVHQNISDYGGDPERIGLIGHSSGAQVSSLLITDQRRLEAHGLGLAVVKAAVLLDGHTYNLEARFAAIEDPAILAGPYSKFGDTPEHWRDASAMAHIGPDKGHPPTLLVAAGIQFQQYPPGMASDELAGALRTAGVEVESFMAKSKNHDDVDHDVTSDDEMSRAVVAFLDRHLKKE